MMDMTQLTTTQRARTARRAMPLAARILWQSLRGKQVSGHKFRRQHPIAGYLVDFACLPHRLVVEVDDAAYRTAEIREEARRRMLDLMRAGWTVLRLRDVDVFDRLEQVLATIARHLPADASESR